MTHSRASFRPHALALASAISFALPISVKAAAPLGVPTTPGAGQFLQQVPQATPEQNNNPGLTVQAPASATSTDKTPIPVSHVTLKGNTAFDAATLHALVADAEGKTLTLGDLDAYAKRIADFYHAHGYLVAQALVPPQSVTDGTVTIEIVEAHYDRVHVENHSRVSSTLLESTLASVKPGAIVEQKSADHALLLLSDIPGTSVHGTLSPGQAPGTTDLAVVVDPGTMWWGQAGVDDEGDRYTGRVRGFGTVGVNDLLHWGDVLSLDAMTTGRGMTWGRIGYQSVLTGIGTQAGVSYSFLDYRLGGSLSPLGGHGTAGVFSGWASQPLIRSKTLNVTGKIEYDHHQLSDALDSVNWDDKRRVDGVTFSLNGDNVDPFFGGGVTHASLALTRGWVGFENSEAEAADAATAQTKGPFTAWTAGINRLQNLPVSGMQLYASVSYQHGNRNLDSSQQWVIGGPGTIRGYRVTTLSGADGALETVELRQMFAVPVLKAIQASVFFDAGQVTVNAYPWQAGDNHANLMSVGAGLNWTSASLWNARLMVAAPVGPKVELAGERPSAQVWFQVIKQF